MGRVIARVALGIIGVLAMVLGAAAIGGAAWVQQTLDGGDSLTSRAQIVPAGDCETVLIDISEMTLNVNDVDRFRLVADRLEEGLIVSVGEVPDSVLVGFTDTSQVESRLLGTRYCVGQVDGDEWSVARVVIDPQDPDISFDGLSGYWARTDGQDRVVLPVPESGTTLVVTSDGQDPLGDVRLAGRYRIDGATSVTQGAFYAGGAISVLGIALVVISVFIMRRKGRHESGATSDASDPPDTFEVKSG